MLQYLRAERIVPPYQTRGYKLVELVRIYEASNRQRLLTAGESPKLCLVQQRHPPAARVHICEGADDEES